MSFITAADTVNASPTFFKKPTEEKVNLRKSLQKKYKNLNAYSFNNATLYSIEKDNQKRAKNSTKLVDIYSKNINKTPNKNKIERIFSLQKKKKQNQRFRE